MNDENVVGIACLADALKALTECMVTDTLHSDFKEDENYNSRLAELTAAYWQAWEVCQRRGT